MKKQTPTKKPKARAKASVAYASADVRDAVICLDAVEATTSKNEKGALLQNMRDNVFLRDLLRTALDRSTFGVSPAPLSTYTAKKPTAKLPVGFGSMNFGDVASEFFALTRMLAHRALSGNKAKTAIDDFIVSVNSVDASLAKWFHRVLAKKLQANIDRTIDAVWPDLVIRWGVPKGVSLVDQKSNKMIAKFESVITESLEHGVDSQPKCDGVHGVADCSTGAMHSSSGDLYPAVNKYAAAIADAVATLDLPDVFDGYVPLVSGECEADFDFKSESAKWKSPWGKGGAIAKYGRTPTGFQSQRIDAEKQRHIDRDFKFVIYDIYPDIAQRESVKIARDKKRKLLKAIVDYCNDNAEALGIRKNAITLIQQERCYSWDALRAAHEKWIALGYEGSILRFRHSLTLADSKTRKDSVNFMKWKEYDYFDGIIPGDKAPERRTPHNRRIRRRRHVSEKTE
jgi:hypothetical protein